MILNILLFILGIILLVKGSDFFVKHSSIIAKKIGVSEFIIGLTLVAIGTSLPELVASIVASAKNQSGIILGNVVGSNIANICLIGGIIAIFAVTKTKQEIKKRDVMIMIFATTIFYFFMFDRVINFIEGGVFLLLYLAYLVFLLDTNKGIEDKRSFKSFIIFFLKFKYINSLKEKIKTNSNSKNRIQRRNLFGNLVSVIIGGIVIYFGAKLLIDQTIFFGDFFGISKTLIGLSVIALGTSLPELSVSLSAAKKGLSGIAIGNIIGSNVSNIFLVIGASSIINNILVDNLTFFYSGPFMIFISLVFWFLMRTGYELRKKEGIILLILYIIFLVSLVFIK